jgi:hypothetical protein
MEASASREWRLHSRILACAELHVSFLISPEHLVEMVSGFVRGCDDSEDKMRF